MKPFQHGDIIVTMFPFADGQKAKVRPALIYRGPWTVDDFSVCWILMITSSRRTKWSHDISIADLEAAGLPAPSIVRTLKIACIDTHNVVQKIGSLDAKTLRSVQKHMRAITM